MVQYLPRLMLAAMFFSIIALGFAVKSTRAAVEFSAEAFTETTFERS
ncbi:hypothetical protein [Oricola sp.]|nr:hypothetical protein [Oricola sp.]MCI5075213.1 hypothetical protein [Oricola sp.]